MLRRRTTVLPVQRGFSLALLPPELWHMILARLETGDLVSLSESLLFFTRILAEPYTQRLLCDRLLSRVNAGNPDAENETAKEKCDVVNTASEARDIDGLMSLVGAYEVYRLFRVAQHNDWCPSLQRRLYGALSWSLRASVLSQASRRGDAATVRLALECDRRALQSDRVDIAPVDRSHRTVALNLSLYYSAMAERTDLALMALEMGARPEALNFAAVLAAMQSGQDALLAAMRASLEAAGTPLPPALHSKSKALLSIKAVERVSE